MPEEHMWNLTDKSLLHAATHRTTLRHSYRTRALAVCAQLRSFLAPEGSRIKPRTYTFLPQCRYWSKTRTELQSVQNSPWQLNCGTQHDVSVKWRQNKQSWKLSYWCIYSSFSNAACYPAGRCSSNCSRLIFRKFPVRIPTGYRNGLILTDNTYEQTPL
jgi:hypothetical protein